MPQQEVMVATLAEIAFKEQPFKLLITLSIEYNKGTPLYTLYITS